MDSVAANTPDLILLDVAMPEMDGFEVLRQLKTTDKYRHIPVMFLTACIDTQSLLEGFKLGAVDYIPKPCLHEELLARVRTHLELARMRSRLEQQNVDLRQINTQLQEALSSVKILRGLIPICANCKNAMMRDTGKPWKSISESIRKPSSAMASARNVLKSYIQNLKIVMKKLISNTALVNAPGTGRQSPLYNRRYFRLYYQGFPGVKQAVLHHQTL
jgi:DNA-binding response OmpR family regulator